MKLKLLVLGANGRTGVPLVRSAIRAGHDVTALVRPGHDGALAGLGAHIVVGGIADIAAAAKNANVDVVVSALGIGAGDNLVCSRAAAAVIATGIRYVSVSGAGVDVEGDGKTFEARLVSRLVRLFGRAAIADKNLERDALRTSDLAWTLVRAPRLVSGRPKGSYRVELRTGALSSTIDREDLARFLLEVIENPTGYARQAPFVSW